MLTCILLYADIYFFIQKHVPNYNMSTTRERMSTCNQNFNMRVKKKVQVNIQKNACQHAFESLTCMSKQSRCQHTKKCMSLPHSRLYVLYYYSMGGSRRTFICFYALNQQLFIVFVLFVSWIVVYYTVPITKLCAWGRG